MEWNGIEWYHKGNNQKMKNIQGWWQRCGDEDRKTSQPGLLIDPKRRQLSFVLWLTQRVTLQCPK
jgi:hypothetical protein